MIFILPLQQWLLKSRYLVLNRPSRRLPIPRVSKTGNTLSIFADFKVYWIPILIGTLTRATVIITFDRLLIYPLLSLVILLLCLSSSHSWVRLVVQQDAKLNLLYHKVWEALIFITTSWGDLLFVVIVVGAEAAATVLRLSPLIKVLLLL